MSSNSHTKAGHVSSLQAEGRGGFLDHAVPTETHPTAPRQPLPRRVMHIRESCSRSVSRIDEAHIPHYRNCG